MSGYATPHEQHHQHHQQHQQQDEEPPSSNTAAASRTIIHVDNPNSNPSDDATGGAYRELAARILLLPELEDLTSPSSSPAAGPGRSGAARRKLLVDMCGCGMLVDELESKIRRQTAAATSKGGVGVGVVMPRVWMVDDEGAVEHATSPPAAGDVSNDDDDDDDDDYDETADGEADKNGDEQARPKFAAATAPAVVVTRSENGQMPFPDAYFDYTITIATRPESFTSTSPNPITNINTNTNTNIETSSPRNRIAETHRVLRPGGISIYASSPRIAYSPTPFPLPTPTSTTTTFTTTITPSSPPTSSSHRTNFCQAGPSPQTLLPAIRRALAHPATPYERAVSLPIHYSHATPQSLYDALRLRFASARRSRDPDASRTFDEGLREFVDDHGEWWWRLANDDNDDSAHEDLCAQGEQEEGEGQIESRFGVKMDAAVYICGKNRDFDLSVQSGDDGGTFGLGSPSASEAGDVERMMASRRPSSSQGAR